MNDYEEVIELSSNCSIVKSDFTDFFKIEIDHPERHYSGDEYTEVSREDAVQIVKMLVESFKITSEELN